MYCVFKARGDQNWVTHFELMCICKDLDSCYDYIETRIKTLDCHSFTDDIYPLKPVHCDMNKNNNYSFIGKRESCSRECRNCNFGGFVIEYNNVHVAKQKPYIYLVTITFHVTGKDHVGPEEDEHSKFDCDYLYTDTRMLVEIDGIQLHDFDSDGYLKQDLLEQLDYESIQCSSKECPGECSKENIQDYKAVNAKLIKRLL